MSTPSKKPKGEFIDERKVNTKSESAKSDMFERGEQRNGDLLDLIDNVFFQNLKENERRNSDAVFDRPVTCQLDTFRKQFVVGAIPETGSW